MIRKRGAVEESRVTIVACIFNDVASGVTVVVSDAADAPSKEGSHCHCPVPARHYAECGSDECCPLVRSSCGDRVQYLTDSNRL